MSTFDTTLPAANPHFGIVLAVIYRNPRQGSVNHNTSLENTDSLVVAADGPARLKIMQIVTGGRVIGREEWRGYFQVWTPPIFIGRNGSKSKDRRGLNTRQTGKGAGFSGKKNTPQYLSDLRSNRHQTHPGRPPLAYGEHSHCFKIKVFQVKTAGGGYVKTCISKR